MVSTNSGFNKSNRPAWVVLLAVLAALTLGLAAREAGRMMRMRTHAASNAELSLLKADEQAKVVVEITEASGGGPGGHIRGKLLEKLDETHYRRSVNPADVTWGKETTVMMGKAEDIRAGAVV